jgi:WD40 repeat protein
MARLRYHHALSLLAVVAVVWAAPARAVEAPTGLYDRPMLVLEPGMHTAPLMSAAVDAIGRYAVTGSEDKTVRVWALTDGRLARTIRLPAGPGGSARSMRSRSARTATLLPLAV